jgi:hypothetical protein
VSDHRLEIERSPQVGQDRSFADLVLTKLRSRDQAVRADSIDRAYGAVRAGARRARNPQLWYAAVAGLEGATHPRIPQARCLLNWHATLRRFNAVTVLNGHIHQIVQHTDGNIRFATAASTAYPQPAPGTADKPGPLKVPSSKLLSVLGYRSVEIARNAATITDHSLQT